MASSNSFRKTFAAAVLIGFIDWALPIAVAERTYYLGFWLGYVVLATFGFLATREGHRYSYVFKRTFAFAGFWFFLGLLNFAIGRGEPVEPGKPQLAFYGYLMASALFLPVALATSFIGVLAARLSARFRHDSSTAG